jgi:molecular chaperone GrpE
LETRKGFEKKKIQLVVMKGLMKVKVKQDQITSEDVQTEESHAQVLELDQKDVEALKGQITKLTEQVEEVEGKYRRVLADYQNLERQTGEEQRRFAKIATQLFVEQMLTPFDHLQMAAAHLKDKGLDLVITQFRQLFESQGLKELEVAGKPFDPERMEVVGTGEGKTDVVVEVLQAGYELNGVVIRPARVIVGK